MDLLAPVVLGLHLLSAHAPNSGEQAFTLGLYVRTAGGGLAGVYRNSIGKHTAYLGYSLWQEGQFDFALLAATGYHRKGINTPGSPGRVALIPVASWKYDRHRFSLIPAMGSFNSAVTLHYSLEWDWRLK